MKLFSRNKVVAGALLLTMMVGQSAMAMTTAPYIDSTLSEVPDLVQVSKQTGINRFNLGFITADANGKPSWGGKYPLLGSPMEQQIKNLRAVGGDVIVSVGGAKGTPLHVAIKDEGQLTNALAQIVSDYRLEAIDFDIEGAGLKDVEAARRLMRSIASLQKMYRSLDIWLTLPVAKDGLTADGKSVVDYAVRKGVNLEGINLMVMNYGYEGNAPSDMSDNAIGAASAVVTQLDEIYKRYNQPLSPTELWDRVGLTPMIGVNDTGQVFTLEDARQLVAFAKQKNIGYMGYWSLARDKQGSLGIVAPNYSGIQQEPLAYSKIFGGNIDQVVGTEIKVLPIGPNDVTETTTYFEWEKVTEAKTYKIYRDGILLGTTEQLEYTDSNLKVGTTYYYMIEGMDQTGKVIARSKSFGIATKGQGGGGTVTLPPTGNVPSGSWQPGIEYKVGDVVTYNNKTYQCVQPHRALGDWQPPSVPALWNILPNGKGDANGTVWDVQVQYKPGDVVTYNGMTYSCIQSHKSLPGWEPDKTPALWGAFRKQ